MTTPPDTRQYFDTYLGGFAALVNSLPDQWSGRADVLQSWANDWVIKGYIHHDVDALVSWVAPDFTQDDPMNMGRLIRGPHEFRAAMQDTFHAFPDCAFAADGPPQLSIDGFTISIPWRTWGTFTGALRIGPHGNQTTLSPTGRPFDFKGLDLYTFRDNKVTAMRSYYDPLLVAQQLGLIPPTQAALRLAARAQALIATLQRARHRR